MALIATKATEKRKPPFLPDDILNKLKCVDCGGYLSTPPIMKHPELGSICGNCAPFIQNNNFIRNEEYETIASFVEFPCKNKGCHKRIKFGEYTLHDYECLFKDYVCPLQTLKNSPCPWYGHYQLLGCHFENEHKNFFLKENSFFPELRKNCEQIRLYIFNNSLFFIQTKCVISECKFWCLIRYIGKPKISNFFTYKLEIIGNKSKKSFITNEKSVQTDICLLMESRAAIEFNIDTLLKYLNCPLEIKCKIHMKYTKQTEIV